ncbi:Protein O-linked-mannose beta-1,4-N-acetylglucosaminyltransferase 2 [Holothuria leucospilota]|uniref:Protein O-linked-mannose beta-1,4-N-acetylglucosaminyltransferase 2 n=1 Tax=Holothuria leucospilota TaxID=206669 RepID=A0A9Q0YJ84_HOLLE|nr:Protein O-linked-mannose beta-1,4-N-acetylglucosaminyltransferase 2 [Holothuria leucospilota]
MGAPAVCERSCGYGCTQQHVLNRTRYSRRELRSRTSFLAHAELETGVAARKFRRCNEKSRAAARACLGKQPARQTREMYGILFSRKLNRKILNEKELVNAVSEKFNIKILELSMEANALPYIIETVSCAKLVMGIHGAMLILAMFLPPSSILLEMYPYAINPMYPPNQQQVLGNQQYPHVVTGAIGNQNPTNQKLWGGNVRRIMGILQIVFGGIELAIGIAVIVIPNYYFYQDYVGWGIWTGVFAIVTGFLGVFSVRTKCMVIAYMVTSIITAVMSAGCCLYAIIGASRSSISYYYRETANLALYIILCIIVFSQMVISIIGASFTCNAICSTTGQPQQVVYLSPQPMPQQYAPPPQYTVNAPQSGRQYNTTAPTAYDAFVSPKI